MTRVEAARNRLRPTARLAAVACASLALGAAAAGCGSSSPSAQRLVAAATKAGRSVRSGVVNLRLSLRTEPEQSLGGPLSLAAEGPFEARGKGAVPALDLSFHLTSGSTSVAFGVVSTSTAAYLLLGGQAYQLPEQAVKQLASAYANRQLTENVAGVAPLQWLEAPTSEGTKEVGGVETEALSASLNVSRLLSSLSKLSPLASSLGGAAARIPALRALLTLVGQPQGRQEIERSVKQAKVQLWIGKRDDVVRRAKITVDVEPPASQREAFGGLKELHLAASQEISQVNQPQRIVAPANAKPLEDLLSEAGAAGLALG